jgi:dTDP-4-dehydrorhamnose 3,5-epimerase-like enzyme
MKISNLNAMTKGWFIGNFEPTMLNTRDVEVAVKHYSQGVCEARHYHKIATEFTVIISGKVRMNQTEFGAGTIIQIEPGEATDFEAIEDTVTVVIKHPGCNNDKYLSGE